MKVDLKDYVRDGTLRVRKVRLDSLALSNDLIFRLDQVTGYSLPFQPSNLQIYGNTSKGSLDYGVRNTLAYNRKVLGYQVELKNNMDYNVQKGLNGSLNLETDLNLLRKVLSRGGW